MEALLGEEGRRRLRLRRVGNEDLFRLYDSELALRLHNSKNLSDTRKLLIRFRESLNGHPPSAELAKGFLAQYANRMPRTLYRYAQMLRVFMKWYGEPLNDLKIKVPKTIPPYTEDSDIGKLYAAIENKRSHKGCIVRDLLLVELALKSGMRRGELANLEVKDVHADFLVVRGGKGGKDRVIPLAASMAQRLKSFMTEKKPTEKVFGLKGPCISNKIRQFAKKAGLEDFHAHTMRHKFATDLLDRGANVKVVQELLGHENLATTEVYLSVTNESLRDAVNTLESHPKEVSKTNRLGAAEAMGEANATRMDSHLAELAVVTEIIAHHVERLVRYKDHPYVRVVGDIMGGLSFWSEADGMRIVESPGWVREFAYEKEHPIDPYLASCVLRHYEHRFGKPEFDEWSQLSIKNVTQDILKNLQLMAHAGFKLCPTCPICKEIVG